MWRKKRLPDTSWLLSGYTLTRCRRLFVYTLTRRWVVVITSENVISKVISSNLWLGKLMKKHTNGPRHVKWRVLGDLSLSTCVLTLYPYTHVLILYPSTHVLVCPCQWSLVVVGGCDGNRSVVCQGCVCAGGGHVDCRGFNTYLENL